MTQLWFVGSPRPDVAAVLRPQDLPAGEPVPKMGILYPMQDMDDYFIAFLYWNLWWLGATTILGNLDMNEYVGI